MDIVSTKVIVGILFGAVRFLSGILPIYIYKWLKLLDDPSNLPKNINRSKREQLVTCSLALFQSFGGGVLFATCFLHMMPEVYYCVDELKHYGDLEGDYPYSQLIVSSGFFLVYFVEEVSQYLISITPKEGCKNKFISSRSVSPEESKIATRNGYTEKKDGIVNEITFLEADSPKKIPYIIEVQKENEKNLDNAKSVKNAFEESEKTPEVVEKTEEAINEEFDKLLETEVKTQQQILRCFLIVIALSLHAIFEGLAIGLQHSVGSIWYLFVAVSVHSATILFCIGLELLKARTRLKTLFIHIFILSVTSPIGIFMGLGISLSTETNEKAKSVAIVVLEGLSAGTILYITFFEVLNREKELRIYRLRRAICIMAGFAMMALLESFHIYN